MILDLFRKDIEFHNIQGYGDIKDIVRRALDAEDNYNLLFIGPPASSFPTPQRQPLLKHHIPL